MPCAPKSARFNERTRVVAVSKRLHRLRRATPNERIASSESAGNSSRGRIGAQTLGQDVHAFQQMFATARPKFVAMAHAILRNREDAEDAVQNAFLSGHLHLRSFEGRSAIKTWFTRIVLNAALMIRRKRRPLWTDIPPETNSSDDARWVQSIPASQPDPEMAYARQETSQFLEALLGKMKPALRQAITMTYYDELSGPEACAILGVSAATLKTRLFRARRELANRALRILAARAQMSTPSELLSTKNALQPLLTGRSVAASSVTAYMRASFS